MTTGLKEAHKRNLITMHHLHKRVLDPSVSVCRELAGALDVCTLFFGTNLFTRIKALPYHKDIS